MSESIPAATLLPATTIDTQEGFRMRPAIRCGLTEDGHIEASISLSMHLIMDRRTGEVLYSSAKEGTDEFRWMVNAAREHVSK